jgi:uncharacterized repeat protein (TIGR03803 family)
MIVGVTQSGGANNRGTIFTVSNQGTGFIKRYDYLLPTDPADEGSNPFSGLYRPPTGLLLYGVAQNGGANDEGVLYSVNYSTWDVTVLRSLGGLDGETPLAEINRAANGLLYGSTKQPDVRSHQSWGRQR